MQFICVARSKSSKELGAFSSPHETAAFVEPLIDEEDLHDGAAYGFNQRKNEGKGSNLWKNFVCGVRPTLTRSCANPECPSTPQRTVEGVKDCKDRFSHCNLPILKRYCALPQFQISCCHSCANYLSK